MIPFALAATAIDAMARPVDRVRHQAGSYVAGKFVDGPTMTLAIRAAHQPAGPRDLVDVPEGQRVDAQRAIWSRSEILGADETTGRRADDLLIEGETWRVLKAWPRTEAGFYRAIVGLKNDRQRGL